MKRFALPFLAFFFGAFLIYPLVGLLDGAFLLADAQGHRHFTLSFFQLLIENRLYHVAVEMLDGIESGNQGVMVLRDGSKSKPRLLIVD